MNNLGKIIGTLIIAVSYGIAVLASAIWINYLPAVYHGVADLKAHIIIFAIFQWAWICSNFFALLGHSIILVFYCRASWFYIFVAMQFLLFLFVSFYVL